MVRRLTLVSLFAVFTGSACSEGTENGAGDVAGAADGPRDTLVVAVMSDIGSLNPVVASSSSDSAIMGNIYMPLVDAEFDCSLKKLPGVATDLQWNEDGTILTMTLRDDIKWADGNPVTAEDIAFTYELLADPAVATPRMDHIARMKPEGRPKIVSPTQIEWHFVEAYDRDTQTSHASLGYIPKHVLGDADRGTLRGHAFSKDPLESGPFKIAKYEPGQTIVLEPNEKFTGPADMKPQLQRVIFKVVPEYSTRLLELQNGQIDMMESITPADADMLRESNPDINIVRKGWRSMDYVAWNMKDPLFSDVRVRQALAMSVDVEDMIAKLLTSKQGEAYARRSVGTITPELCGVHNDDIAPLAHDDAKAKALLAEAGWTDSNGDGILDKDGKKFEFTLMTNQGNKRRGDAAIRLQSQWKDLGVVMNIETIEFNNMTERLKQRDFQAALGGWSAGLYVDPSAVWGADTPERKNEFNYTSYNDEKVSALIERGLKTPDPQQAAPIWKELQAEIYADQPYLFLWWMDELVGINNRFENTGINVMSSFDNLHDWSVPPEKVKYKR